MSQSNHALLFGSMRLVKKVQPTLVCLLALMSILPLQLLIFGDEAIILQGQLAGIMYTMILIAFFCGAQWSNALKRKFLLINVSSLLLAITPWFLVLARRYFNEEVLWAFMAGELMLILLIDWIYFRKHYPKWYFMLRNLITLLLSASIIIICIRKSVIY